MFTGKNDLTCCVTHTEAVFRPVICSIFDVWLFAVLSTSNFTRLLWYECDYGHLKLYIMLRTIKWPNVLYCTLPSTPWSALMIALDCILPACLTVLPTQLWWSSQAYSQAPCQVHFQLHSTLHSEVHSQEGRHSQPHFTIWSHVPFCMLNLETS